MAATSNRRAQGILRALSLVACVLFASSVLPASAQTTVVNTVTVTNPAGVGCTAGGTCAVSAVDSETVNAPQLTLTKTASATGFTVGTAASYTLTLANTGAASTTAVSVITDTIPTGLTIGAMPSGCAVSGQTVTCTVATGLQVGAGNAATFVIPVTPQASAPVSLTNTASVTGGGDSSCPATTARCQSSVTTAVVASINAVDDASESISNAGGLASTVSVVTNDTVNTAPATLGPTGNATLSLVSLSTTPVQGGITLDPQTGRITVAAGTTPGNYTLTYQLCINPATSPATCDTATKPIVVTSAALAYDFCPVGNNKPVFNIINNTGSPRTVNIRRYDASTGNAVDVPALATSASGDTNGLMVDPVANRLLFLTSSSVYAYDATNGGWYVAGTAPATQLPRAGMNRNGVGYLISSGATPTIYSLTRNGFNYTTGAAVTMTYDVAPTDLGSGDIAFDSAGEGWLTAGLDLYTVNVTTGRATRQTRPVFANGSATTVNWAGVAFTQDGHLVLADNTSPTSAAYYLYDRTTGIITKTSNSGGSRDLASCGFPVQAAPQLSVSKTLAQVNGAAYVAGSAIKAGDTLNYSIRVTNSGTAVATLYPGEVIEILPANTTVVAAGNAFACSGSSCPNTAVTNVAVNASNTLNFIVQVNATLASTITTIENVVAVQVDGTNLCTASGNDCTESTPVALPIDAVNDTFPAIAGATGGSTTSVLTNDSLNGQPVSLSTVTLTPGTSPHAGITMNADGTITVAAGTPGGTYSYPYTICETASPTNCETATATVVVTAPIVAVNDTFPAIAGAAGGSTTSVLTNDSLNGQPVTLTTVTLTPGASPHAGITMNPDGTITVAPGTSGGTYSYPYTICEIASPTNCATATATVVVTAPITAVNDSAPAINGGAGGTTPSVLGNDTLNGQPVTPSTVTLTPGASPHAGITMNPDGTITVAPGTPGGTYSYPYTICEIANPTNCATAVATVVVTSPIIAVNDTFPAIASSAGGSTATVLANDTLNGQPVTLTTVTLTPGVSPHAGITMNPDGTITVAPGTTGGTYSYPYTICEIASPTNCATATATVVVTAPIMAVNDSAPAINGGAGGTTPSVLGNDTLNGQPVTPSTVTLTPGASPHAGITMNPDGTITVAPGTPGGTYSYPYTICEIANPTNCATAVATVVVASPIDAVNDSYPGVIGGSSTASVLVNDTLNGQPVAPSTVTLTPGASPHGGITMNPDGTITVATGTPAGTYSYPYTICEIANPTNCDTATATLVVAPPIVAVNDSLPQVNESGTTPSVLTNDTLNGQPVTLSTVILTPGTSPQAGITMNPDGTITVAPGTPAGVYSYPYTICEIANPANCATAVATVTVVATPIVGVNDTPPTINGEDGGTTPSVLGNDTLGGRVVDPSMIVLTPGVAPYSRVVMNPNGTITIPAGTPAGTYSYPYTICEAADPSNCASAVATVIVASSYDIRLLKTVAVSQVVVGDLVRYTLTVENVGDGAFLGGSVLDTPPAGFTYVEGSLVAGDGDNAATVSGQSPIRIEGVDVAAGKSATFIYLMRVGAGVRQGTQVNQAQAFTAAGAAVSNIATAAVTVQGDPLVDESLLFGTVFDDRDGDGWQDSAAISGLHVQGGFDPGAYVPNSTVMDAGNGWQPQADASAPLLHGIAVGAISARQSMADPVDAHQVVIRQVLTAPRFTDDFVLTTKQGVTVHMDAAGQTRVENSRDAAKGLNAAEPTVERHVSQGEQGYVVDYVIRNAGIDERGIPGVRVATVDGMLIETDQFGRYHLEGVSSGDWARGRNFIFKVDPSTLPAGAVFTTANPLVRRITTGMPTRFDFGVKLPVEELKGQARTVELELGQVLFAPGSAELKPQYLPAVDRIAGQVEAYRGGEVVIDATGEAQALAFDRANAVKAALLQKLTPETVRALTVSVRTEVQDPASMLAGLDGRGPLLGSVLFETDKAEIKPQFGALLDRIAGYLQQQGGGVISVVGHADRRGADAYNVDLGLRRAKAVYQAIAQRLPAEMRAKVRVESSNDPTAPAGVAGQ